MAGGGWLSRLRGWQPTMTRRHDRAPRARPSGGTAPEPQKNRHAWHEPRPSFWGGPPPQRKIAVCMGGARWSVWGRMRRHEEVRAADAARARRGDHRGARLVVHPTRRSSSPPAAPHSPQPDAHARGRAGRERRPCLPLGRSDESRLSPPPSPESTRSPAGAMAAAAASETRRAGSKKVSKLLRKVGRN